MEGCEDIQASLVSDADPSKLGEPCKGPLDLPAMTAETGTVLDTAPGNTGSDAASVQGASAPGEIISLVRMKLGRAATWPAGTLADGLDGIDRGFQHPAVVDVGGGQGHGERNTVGVDDDVALGARLAPVRRVRACADAPLFAGTLALSSAARLQSIALALPKRSSRTWCSFSQTPAACQSRSRRQQVMPEPQPISRGSISHGMPLFRTNRMPVRAARSSTGGRPPFGRGGRDGKSGATTAQSSSLTRGFAMPIRLARLAPNPRFC